MKTAGPDKRYPRDCKGCGLPMPNDYCWENRWDCWASCPPRNLTTMQLWERIKELESALTSLEERVWHLETGEDP